MRRDQGVTPRVRIQVQRVRIKRSRRRRCRWHGGHLDVGARPARAASVRSLHGHTTPARIPEPSDRP
ncbi:hypothetical protein ABZ532_12675 [Streptomyces sp. NPDC019396]|uniref:hypothetical protein n=1 Tax=Streptomyces sp. NPDC019396 TaxID=3154687 RepID=UPI0034094DDD